MAIRRAWILLLLLPYLLSGCGSSSRASAPNISGGTELDQAVESRIAQMSFVDDTGHAVRLADFRGKTIVLQGTSTLCQESCPIDTAAFVNLARKYAADPAARNVVFVTVTIDPERDTVAQLAAYRKLYAGESLPQWRLLTGKSADVMALWKYLHVWVAKAPSEDHVKNWRTGQVLTYDVDHMDVTFFIDRTLTQRYLFTGPSRLSGDMPGQMDSFMSDEGHHNEHRSGWSVDQALTVLHWLAT